MDDKNVLSAFDPKALTFSEIGVVDCFPQPNLSRALAIDANGTLWATSDASYDIYQIDTSTAHCTKTSYQPPAGFLNNGAITFAASMPGSVAETLYMDTGQAIYTVDPQNWQTTMVGAFQPNPQPVNGDGPALTGTSDARLFSLWVEPSMLAEIDPSSGALLSSTTVPDIPDKAWAMAAWGGGLWIFALPSPSGAVFRYDLSTKSATPVAVSNPPNILSATTPLACSP
jgi:hypothetical protein